MKTILVTGAAGFIGAKTSEQLLEAGYAVVGMGAAWEHAAKERFDPLNSASSKDMTLAQISQKTKYSAKYLNLLVRQGKLEARKEGRNWVSSLDALRRYEESRLRKR